MMPCDILKDPGIFFNRTSAIVMIFDAGGEPVWMNSACEQFSGCSPADFQKNIRPLFLSEDRERFFSLIRRTLAGHPSESPDISMMGPDGARKSIRWNTMLITDDQKQSRSAVVVFGLIMTDSALDMTSERKAHQLVRESEAKLCSLVDNMRDGLYRCDSRGTIVFCNPAGARLMGYDNPEELIGRNATADFYFSPVQRDDFFKKLRAQGEVSNYEVTLKHKNGSGVIVLTDSRYFYDADGNILGVEGLFTDITRRRETEKKLLENEERLQAITRNMPGVVYQFEAGGDGTYSITYISGRMKSMFGLFEDSSSIFQAFLARIHEKDRDRLMESIAKAVKTCTPWNFEGRFVKPAGDLIWFQGLSTPVRHDDRLVFNGILLDITEQKKAEEASRQTEEKFYKVFATSPDCIAITRLSDGRIADVNMGFEGITGWRRDQVIGRTSLDIAFWNDPAGRQRMTDNLTAGKNIENIDFQFRRKDGSLRSGIYSARHINIDGEPHLIFVMQDVTSQKSTEEERRKLEEQLFQSQKMDAIGQLASGVAHDFNNILTGIQGNASLIRMEYAPDHPTFQRLSRIEENVKRGANLTRQLLGFARGGKYEVKTLDINGLIRKNVQFFTETRKEIEAEFELHDSVYPVDVDAGQIDQVLLNIYINAGHAMPGGGTLHIRTDNVALAEKDAAAFEIPAGDYVKISISDTGTGMDHATLQRVFEPFFTTRGKQGGTGLGLASAYGIVRNHGGAICAESIPGQGSTFILYLPSSLTDIKREDPNTSESLVSGNGVILVVDDEPMILSATSEMLRMLGYTVYQAGSGQEAVSLYMQKKGIIDLVILDMILPGISGAQVLKFIKDINPGVRVILSSGYSIQGEVRKVMNMGCAGFIQKPYSFADLSGIIRKVIHPPAVRPDRLQETGA